MRASRQTELARAFPLHVVTKWLGNTPQIALKHDLQVTNQDFARAWARSLSTGAAQSAAKGLQKGCKIRCIKRTHRIARANQKRQKPLTGRGLYETVRRLATWHQTSEWRGQDVNL